MQHLDATTSAIEPAPDPELFLNRELSLLEFNQRVLAQARNPNTPLLERLFFLTITSTNLDEFFEVRAASHRERASLAPYARTIDGRTSAEILDAIGLRCHQLVREQYEVLNRELLPALQEKGIRLIRRQHWNDRQSQWIREYFEQQVLPVLTPIGLDPAHPFPRILNKSLNFILSLDGEDALGRNVDLAVVQVPRTLPRVIALPQTESDWAEDYVLLSSIIHAHVDQLFESVQVNGCYQFRVTRDGDLWVDEEEVEDLLTAIQGELPERRYAQAVRLEVAQDCPDHVAHYLLKQFDLESRDLYRVNGPVNLHRLAALCAKVERADLKYSPFAPLPSRRMRPGTNIFDAIRNNDVLLHHPYETFSPVLDLLQTAARDPEVLAIKQTVYRTGAQSPISQALIDAAKAGKQVTAVIELRARFDEAQNIELARQLQEAGANVTYGIVGYKTHAKAMMVVRREGNALVRYCHLATGNYHPGTAKTYTDIGFLTADPVIGEDVHRFFTQLTGVGEAPKLEVLIQSPFQLLRHVLERIEFETEQAKAGRPARIAAKINALTEPRVIRALYTASQAGVQVELVVRGACCLRPGLPGISENIRVRSVIGRFLEHSRLYYFHAGGEELLYASSADWMSRNLLRRVELCFPISNPAIRQRVMNEDLLLYWRPGAQGWESDPEGRYRQAPIAGGEPFDCQEYLMARYLEHAQLNVPEA
ncbi:MAG: polyphosphate kinase 1 [Planctomycetota bacterium]